MPSREPVAINVVATGKSWPALTVKVPAVPTVNVVLFTLVMVGASSTVSVKDCVVFGVTPLLAVMVKQYVPPVPTAGVPLKVAVPLWLSTKFMPSREPVAISVVATGKSWLVLTMKVPAVPVVNVVLFTLVMVGASFTVSENDCVAFGVTPLLAVMVKQYVPPVPTAGAPLNVAVPLPLSANVRPSSDPVSLSDATGAPEVITVNAPAVITVNVAEPAVVKEGLDCSSRSRDPRILSRHGRRRAGPRWGRRCCRILWRRLPGWE